MRVKQRKVYEEAIKRGEFGLRIADPELLQLLSFCLPRAAIRDLDLL
jgi:hypothetical protein